MAAVLWVAIQVGVKKGKGGEKYYQPDKGFQKTGKEKTRRYWRGRKVKD